MLKNALTKTARCQKEIKPTLKEACSQVNESAICVQKLDDSRNSAIRITYRISLRSSSLREPRYPLLRVVVYFWSLGDAFFSEEESTSPQLEFRAIRFKGLGCLATPKRRKKSLVLRTEFFSE